ncbi:MAG: phosphotransferase [Alphaproteobacteria bacterium]|nr:phosphotransferase [Alphaproteobacteria bacterium]
METAAYKKLSIADFRPEEHHLLGEGVWGQVYDLGDGTVLKLAKETSSGIGNGREKIEREYTALNSLAGASGIGSFLPRVVEWGDVPPNSDLARSGIALWLRSTKKEGDCLFVSEAKALPVEEQELIGHSIGKTLAHLHTAMASIPYGQGLNPGTLYSAIKEEVSGNPFYTKCIAILEEELALIPSDILNRAAHNDYNISNLLFSGHDVCAVLDFAEWGPCFPEKDVSDIVQECPFLTETLIEAYESVSAFKIDRRRLELGLAENALYGAVISERRGDAEEHRSERDKLCHHLKTLGYDISEPRLESTLNHHRL